MSENYKWSYGRQCRVGDSKEIIIKLPVKLDKKQEPIIDKSLTFSSKGFIPDFDFMIEYISSLKHKQIKTNKMPAPLHEEQSKVSSPFKNVSFFDQNLLPSF